MKKYKLQYPIVTKVKPIFYKKCTFCECKFKHEIGYKITGQTYTSYCCNECADNEDKVKDKLIEKYNNRRPPRPGSSI